MTKQQAVGFIGIVSQLIPPVLVGIVGWSANKIGNIEKDVQDTRVQIALIQQKIELQEKYSKENK